MTVKDCSAGVKVKKIRLAVMDMWKAFEKSTRKNVSQAAILCDKFHVKYLRLELTTGKLLFVLSFDYLSRR
ncbi:MAG: transposase [Candidatus Brocadia sp.]